MPIEHVDLDTTTEVLVFDGGQLAMGALGPYVAWKLTAEPGWRWAEHLKPLEGTESCEGDHLLFVVSGRLGTRLDSGEEAENGPGEAVRVPPGHDAWAVGTEPLVLLGVDPA